MSFLPLAALCFAGAHGNANAQFVTIYNTGPVVAPVAMALTGTVQVLNQGGEMLTVLIDGQQVGTAGSGLSTFANVPAGYKVIQLQNTFGVVRSVGRFFLAANGAHTWTVAPPQIMIPTVTVYTQAPIIATVNVMQTGAVHVENRLPTSVNVFIAGRMFGSLHSGQTAVYYNVPTGGQTVIAYNQYAAGQEVARQNVFVQPGTRQYVNLLPQFGVVRVINSRADAVQITVDNGQHTWVQPGQTIDIPNVALGVRAIAAVANGQVAQNTSATIYAGQVFTWYVRAATGTIRVVNRLFEPVNLSINGVQQGLIHPQQERFFLNLEVGRRNLVATDFRGMTRAASDLELSPGESRLWVIHP
jgi:hypothetical protein